ncbi:MAG: arylsulfatase [Cyclobacteriaceae bacterium]
MGKVNRTIYLIAAVAMSVAGCISNEQSESQSETESAEPNRPNIIYILADDLGYGDLSIYGQEKFETPNIDALAKQGMLFTQHYSGATVCAPSRSALLTGLHTGHTPIRGNKEVRPEGQYPLPDSVLTLPKLMKNAGYVTGAFGKWGLGAPGSEGDPMNQGVDEFYGYNCQRFGHNYYPYHLWHNSDSLVLEDNAGNQSNSYAPELIHQQALNFIEENKDQPFFLFMPSIIPHAELVAPETYMKDYRGRFDPEPVYEGVDEGPEFRQGPYMSQKEPHAAFVAMIHILDQQVGEIVEKVKAQGIEDNTLIIFTSDNGPHLEGGADPDFFNSNGIYKGYKRDLYEGGIRVPMIASWPSKIRAGSTSEHISAFWDVLPTLAELTGQSIPNELDGLSFLPTLLGEPIQARHDYLYWEFHEKGGRKALRQGDWKIVQYDVNREPQGSYQLYNLIVDPSEEQDLANQHPEKLEDLKVLIDGARTDSEVFVFGSSTYLAK